MLTLDTAVAPNPDVMAAEVEEGLVLLVAESNTYLVLNDTARAVWTGLEHAQSAAGVSRWLASRYEVSEGELEQSVLRTLQTFLQRGLIVAPPTGDVVKA